MALDTVLYALRRGWWAILLVAAIAAGGAGIYARQTPAAYVATAEGIVSVSDPTARPAYAFSSGSLYILNRMTSYARLGVTTPVLEPVVEDLQLQETPLSLSGRISSSSLVGQSVIKVTVRYNDAELAAKIADAAIAQIGVAVSDLESGNVEVRPAGAALVPAAAEKPNGLREAAVGGVAGLLLAGVLAVASTAIAERRSARSRDG
ncbi:hypothetical protein [Mycobacterium sp. C31M]